MIIYNSRKGLGFDVLFRRTGSAMYNRHSLPMAIISAVISICISNSKWMEENFVLGNPQVYFGGLAFIVGFVVVYRAQLAIDRYTTAQISYYSMVSKLSDMAMFAKVWIRGEDEISQKLLCSFLRWLQLYHELGTEEIQGFEFSAKYPRTHLTTKEAELLLKERKRPFTVMGWILNSVALNRAQVLSGDPVIARIYVLASEVNGLFNEARRISETPFPFPFAQITMMMITMWAVFTPIVISSLIRHTWGFDVMLSFFGTWMLFAVNESASQLEQPFDDADNDLPILYYSLAFFDDIQGMKNLEIPELSNVWYGSRKAKRKVRPSNDIKVPYDNGDIGSASSNPEIGEWASHGGSETHIDITDTFRSLFKDRRERQLRPQDPEFFQPPKNVGKDIEAQEKEETVYQGVINSPLPIPQPKQREKRSASSGMILTESNIDNWEAEFSVKRSQSHRHVSFLAESDAPMAKTRSLSSIPEETLFDASDSFDDKVYNTVAGASGEKMLQQLRAELKRQKRSMSKLKRPPASPAPKPGNFFYGLKNDLSTTVRLRRGFRTKSHAKLLKKKNDKNPSANTTNFKPTQNLFAGIDERSPFTLLRRKGVFDRVR